MSNNLTLEKLKVSERLILVESSVASLDKTVTGMNTVLFGEKGEKGVVAKLSDMHDIAKRIEGTISWIAKLIFGAILLAALPSISSFINIVLHVK